MSRDVATESLQVDHPVGAARASPPGAAEAPPPVRGGHRWPRQAAGRRRGGSAGSWSSPSSCVPLVEIYVLIQVGQVIGPWWTILLLVADSILGGWLIRREGRRAWRALTTALDSGQMPARELADGALILIGGTLMLTPGFVTDALGILLILPFTRPVARRLLTSVVSKRLVAGYRRRTSDVADPARGDRWSGARSSTTSERRLRPTSARFLASTGCLRGRGAGERGRSRRRGAARAAP